MTRRSILLLVFFAVAGLLNASAPVHATITGTGSLDPADPNTWTSSSTARVGYTADGSVRVDSGSDLLSMHGYIAYASGVTGEVTIDGAGSTWTNGSNVKVGFAGHGILNITGGGAAADKSAYIGGYVAGPASGATGAATVSGADSLWSHGADLFVGYSGTGTLNIANGGLVRVANNTYVDPNNGNWGTIHFDGGTLETGTLWAAKTSLTGTGTINTHGLIADANLVFDSVDDLPSQTIMYNEPGQDITINLTIDDQSVLGAGAGGAGALAIRNDMDVLSKSGCIGYNAGAAGEVTVEGTGSSWTNVEAFYVGYSGNGTLSVMDSGNVSNGAGYVGYGSGSTGEVTVDGMGSTWAHTNDNDVFVGHSGGGELSITGGGTVTNRKGYIGYNASSEGAVTIDGASSTWHNRSSISVGHSGDGALFIIGGSTVRSGGGSIGTNSGAIGEVLVEDAGSHWLNDGSSIAVGNLGNGALHVCKGGLVSDTKGYIGISSSSTGIVTIEDPHSEWSNSSDLVVGDSGTGTLNIRNGGLVNNAKGYIGRSSGSTGRVTVDNLDSVWDNSSDLYMGHSGNGMLSITGGGQVTNRNGFIGYSPGSMGEVTVDGPGSTWHSHDLYVGFNGDGTLHIDNSGAVTVYWRTYVAFEKGSSGIIDFDHGSLTTVAVWALPTQLTGTGTINTHGILGDAEMVFDSTPNSTFVLNSRPGQNITVNLNTEDPDTRGDLGVGIQTNGSLTVRNGSTVRSAKGYLGYSLGSAGIAAIDGPTSIWELHGEIYVGREGRGTLEVTGGGTVTSGDGFVGNSSGSTGRVAISGAGSHWAAGMLHIGSGGNGVLGISDSGKVSGGRGYIAYDKNSIGEATVNGAGSTWTPGSLCVGYSGNGTLSITNGGVVTSGSGTIGDNFGSTGVVTVEGIGSKWTSGGGLHIGDSGTGTLHIGRGGVVSSQYVSYVGANGGSIGVVTVAGRNSAWINESTLLVGDSGIGMVSIADGGTVSALNVNIRNGSLWTIDVGNGSLLDVWTGYGTIINDGTIRIVAGADASEVNPFTPIRARDWSGSGVIQAIGGTWNQVERRFRASVVEKLASGTPVSLDLADKQRILVTDESTSRSMGASFLAMESSTPIDCVATVIGGDVLADLADELEHDQVVRSAWTLDVTGYDEGDPAYLSLGVGPGDTRGQLTVWRYVGADWTEYDALAFSSDGTYASFTVEDFGAYAVTATLAPGDANGDNKIDEDDAAALAAHWLGAGGWTEGDFNNDDVVDDLDLAILAANWQSGGGSPAVPEPSAWALLAGLAAILGARRAGQKRPQGSDCAATLGEPTKPLVC